MKTKAIKTNRNTWSEQELEVLKQSVLNASKPSIGITEAAKKLGRTVNACGFKFYTAVKPYLNSHKSSNSSNPIKELTNLMPSKTLSFDIKSFTIVDGKLIIEI